MPHRGVYATQGTEWVNPIDLLDPIDPTDVATAMRLVDDIGIDITGKAIWRDRHDIASRVSDPELRDWIEQKERVSTERQ